MRKVLFAVALAVTATVAAGSISAQSSDRSAQTLDLEQARHQLDEARAQLEEAARAIAVQVNPISGLNVALGTRALSRSRLGVVVVGAQGGALVTQVAPGTGAADAGIAVGDVIQSIDDIDLSDGDSEAVSKLFARLGAIEPGDSVRLVVERAGATLDLDVETQENAFATLAALDRLQSPAHVLNAPIEAPYAVTTTPVHVQTPFGDQNLAIFRTLGFASSPWGKMELVAMTEGLGRYFDTSEGLLVVRSPDDDAIDIQDGDVILTIGGRTPNSPEHATRILASFEPGETIEFSIMREGRRETIEYEVPAVRGATLTFPRED
jgi:S1-C subfamily serine protease